MLPQLILIGIGKCVSASQSYLMVAIRDEKICVYKYPEVYDIQTYCLGHRS